MTTNQIQVLLALAERARAAGLIQFNEMPAVLQAIEAAGKSISEANAAQEAAHTKSNGAQPSGDEKKLPHSLTRSAVGNKK